MQGTREELKRPVWLPVCFRAVTESINQLITLCTQQAAGQKECDNALRELEVTVLTYAVTQTYTLQTSFSYVVCLCLYCLFSISERKYIFFTLVVYLLCI